MRVTDLLRTMDIFEALPAEELETIAQLLRERRLAESEVLCRQGEPGDAMFIVTGGRIRLSTTDPSGHEKILTYFTDGQFFGEMSLLTGAPRSATAIRRNGQPGPGPGQASVRRAARLATPRSCAKCSKSSRSARMQTNQQLLADEPGNSVSVGAGRVYAIFSPRGGSGKTTLAVNLAVQHALEQPDRTALLDLSLTFGHTAALLGLQPETSLAAVPGESLADFDRRTLGQYLMRALQRPAAAGRRHAPRRRRSRHRRARSRGAGHHEAPVQRDVRRLRQQLRRADHRRVSRWPTRSSSCARPS